MGYGQDELRLRWQQTGTHVDGLVPRDAPVVWFVDVTIALGSRTSSAAGTKQPQEETEVGHYFMTFFFTKAWLCRQRTGIILSTWFGSNGRYKRIDYVVVPYG